MLSPLAYSTPQPIFLDDTVVPSLGLTVLLDLNKLLIGLADESADDSDSQDDAGNDEEVEVNEAEVDDEIDEDEDDEKDDDDAEAEASKTAMAAV